MALCVPTFDRGGCRKALLFERGMDVGVHADRGGYLLSLFMSSMGHVVEYCVKAQVRGVFFGL